MICSLRNHDASDLQGDATVVEDVESRCARNSRRNSNGTNCIVRDRNHRCRPASVLCGSAQTDTPYPSGSVCAKSWSETSRLLIQFLNASSVRDQDIVDLARRLFRENLGGRTRWRPRPDNCGKAFGSIGESSICNAPVGQLVGPVPVLVDSIAVGYSVLRVTERIPAEIASTRVGREPA